MVPLFFIWLLRCTVYILFNTHIFIDLDAISVKCVMCNQETSGAHSCKMCQNPCHAIATCAVLTVGEENEGFGSKVLC